MNSVKAKGMTIQQALNNPNQYDYGRCEADENGNIISSSCKYPFSIATSDETLPNNCACVAQNIGNTEMRFNDEINSEMAYSDKYGFDWYGCENTARGVCKTGGGLF